MAQIYTPNYNETNEGADFKPVPKGKYLARCMAAVEKNSRDGRTTYYDCEWQIVGGQHDGRKVWGTLTEKSHSQEAEDISRRHINTIFAACGKPDSVRLPKDLEGIQVYIFVKEKTYKANDGTMKQGNEVTNFFDEDTSSAKAQAPATSVMDNNEPPF